MAAAMTSNGQCHRYQEYEMRPTCSIGGVPSRRTGPFLPAVAPAAITAAAPSTGQSAADPGKGVASVNVMAAQRIAPTPTQPRRRLSVDGRRTSRGATMASAAPTPSSQARVRLLKNAAPGWEWVRCRE